MNLAEFDREASKLSGKNPDLIEYTKGGVCDCPIKELVVYPLSDRAGWLEVCRKHMVSNEITMLEHKRKYGN